MCTTRLLTVSQHALRRGVCARGYMSKGGLPLVLGGVYPSMQWGRHPPCGQTDTCENLNLRKLRFRTVIKDA